MDKIYTEWPADDEEDYRFVSSRLHENALDVNQYNDYSYGNNSNHAKHEPQQRFQDVNKVYNNIADKNDAPINFHFQIPASNPIELHHQQFQLIEHQQPPPPPPHHLHHHQQQQQQHQSTMPIQPPYTQRSRRTQPSHEDVPHLREISRSSSQERIENGLPPQPRAASLDIDLCSDDDEEDEYSAAHTHHHHNNHHHQHHLHNHLPPQNHFQSTAYIQFDDNAMYQINNKNSQRFFQNERQSPPRQPQVAYESIVSYQRKHHSQGKQARKVADARVDVIDSNILEKKFPSNIGHRPLAAGHIIKHQEQQDHHSMPPGGGGGPGDQEWDRIERAFQDQLRLRKAKRNSIDHSTSQTSGTLSTAPPHNRSFSHDSHVMHHHNNNNNNNKDLSSYTILPPIGRDATTSNSNSDSSARKVINEDSYEAHFLQERHPELKRTQGYRPYTIRDFKNLKTMDKLGGLGADVYAKDYQVKKEMRERQLEYGDKMMQRSRMEYVSRLKQRQNNALDFKEELTNRSQIVESQTQTDDQKQQQQQQEQEEKILKTKNDENLLNENPLQMTNENETKKRKSKGKVKNVEILSKRQLMLEYAKTLRKTTKSNSAGGIKTAATTLSHNNTDLSQTTKTKEKQIFGTEDLEQLLLRHEEERRKIGPIQRSILS